MAETFRCWVEVDLNALRENLAWLRHRVGPAVKIITVVKADAYGHGLKQIAALLMQSGTDVFGVANLAEARTIRSVGRGWPILMLGACLPDEFETAVRDDVMATVSCREEAEGLSQAARRLHRTARIHLKVDTGMGRLGVSPRQAADLLKHLKRLDGIELAGIYTHYSAAEDDAAFSRRQRARFEALIAELKTNVNCEFIHANNSAGLLFERDHVCNTARPGLLVYGVVPTGKRILVSKLKYQVRPALTWKCRVSLIKEIPKGATLSYGRTFSAPAKMRVATITAGYGDGYLRAGSNRARVLIGGHRCPVLGRVTMDQMIADISRVPQARTGDEVVLIGSQGNDAISANELAAWAGTVPWEVLTNITYRVPRIYRGSHAA